MIPAVPTTTAIVKIHRNNRSRTIATYFQSSLAWGKTNMRDGLEFDQYFWRLMEVFQSLGRMQKPINFCFSTKFQTFSYRKGFFFNLYGLCVKEAWQILLNYQSFSLGDTIEGIFSELFSESCCKSDELINVRLPIWKEKLSPRPNRTPSNFRSNQEKSQKEEQPNFW